MDRRQFMSVAGTATVITLAGCLGGSDTDSPESVAQAWMEAETAEDVEGIIHPESPHDPDDFDEGEEVDVDDTDFEIIGSEIEMENLDEDELAEEFPFLSQDTIEAIADENNAIVGVDFEGEFQGQSFEDTERVLTAEHEGDWLVVDSHVDAASI